MTFIHTAALDNHGTDAEDFDRYDSYVGIPDTGILKWGTGNTWGRYDGGGLFLIYGAETGFPTGHPASVRETVLGTPATSGIATISFSMPNGLLSTGFTSSGFRPFAVLLAGVEQFRIQVDNDGLLDVVDDSGVLGTGTTAISGVIPPSGDEVWQTLEVIWTLSASGGTGSIDVYMDRNLEISLSSIDIGPSGTWDQYELKASGNREMLLDDLVIQDSAGALLNDTHRLWTGTPDADGATTEWTTSSGTDHYALVDDATPDEATTYVESSAIDDRDEFTTSGPTIANNILAVVVKALCIRASGTGDIRLGIDVATVESISSAITVDGTVYKEAAAFFPSPPAGGSWTQADIDGITIIMEATAAGVRTTQVWLEVLANSFVSESTTVGFGAFIESLGPPGQQAGGANFNTFVRDAGIGDDKIKKFSGQHVGKVIL